MSVFERLLPSVGDLVLGRFELMSELGRGGFGVVYKARQTSLDRIVALKLLLPHILANQELVERFEREVAVAKDLQHPNTIRIVDYGKTDQGIPFYAMEFVNGLSLSEVLRRDGPMGEQRARRILVQILKSLAEAHSIGVVHRDLKPANVMLCDVYGEHDFVKVLDFGIAKALTNMGHTTQTGMLLGSPPYMSPEQARADKDIDPRSDLYAVGLMLAECLTGVPVVAFNSLAEVLTFHVSDQPLPFSPLVERSGLWAVVERSTQKNRDLRFANAVEMRVTLENMRNLSVRPLTELMANQVTTHAPRSALGLPDSGQHVLGSGEQPVLGSGQQPVLGSGQQPVMGSGQQSALHTPIPSPTSQIRAVSSLAGMDTPMSAPSGYGQPHSYAPAAVPDQGATSELPARSGVRKSLVFTVLILLIGAVAAAFIAMDRGGGDSIPDDESATRRPAGDEPGANDDDGPGGDDRTTPEDDDTVAAVDNEANEPVDEPVDAALVAATASSITMALSVAHTAVPSMHPVAVDGTNRADIHLNGTLLGSIPTTLLLPATSEPIELRFSRRGYETEMRAVDARTTPALDVRLSREDEPEQTVAVEEEHQEEEQEAVVEETEPELVIPEVTIH